MSLFTNYIYTDFIHTFIIIAILMPIVII